jgi:Domain of unknown function (DUF4145)
VTFHLNSGYAYQYKDFQKDEVVLDFEALRDAALFPKPDVRIPQYLPGLVRETYSDAEFNFHSKKWKAAAQLYLQSLEFSVLVSAADGNEQKAEELSGAKTDLTARINELFKERKLTQSMKEWAHQIRVIGQYHKHRYVEADEEDCKELRSYVELFLTYQFTMPGKIEARRSTKKTQEQS